MFLGVDGGGTKTEFCLVDAQGSIVSTFTTTGCSYLSIGFAQVERLLKEGVAEVCRAAGIDPGAVQFAFFGLPACGESSRDVPHLDQIPSSMFQEGRYRCDNDAVCGWAGSLGAADGINVVAGTGPMAYGEYQGRKARCGGWGEIFGDEGSAYWIAVRGLSCFSKMSDGRLPKGILYDRFESKFGLSRDLDVIDLVFNQWHGDRARMASLSRVVTDSAKAGDPHAVAIMRDAAAELASLVATTRQRLGFPDDREAPVSWSGGVFRPGGLLADDFQRALAATSGKYSLRAPLFSPALGAALYASKLNGTPIAPERLATRGTR